MKRDLIKFLKSKGIRRAKKEGVGEVKLEHLKTSQLATLVAEIEKENLN